MNIFKPMLKGMTPRKQDPQLTTPAASPPMKPSHMLAAKAGVPKPKTKVQTWVDQKPAFSYTQSKAADPSGSRLDAIYAQLKEL